MSNSKIPSPARSLGIINTPRRQRLRRSRSIGSPARTNTSTKLSYIVEEYRMSPHISSPLKTRRSVLSDNTDIEIPGCQSWYKRLDDNTIEVADVLERREQVEKIEEYIETEILSQEKKNYTIDLPESSDGESISSIVIPQRKLFPLKGNLQAQKLFNNVMKNRENFALRKSKSNNDKTVIVGKKDLFNRVTKGGSKSIFSANMQNVTTDNTLINKTKEIENPGKVRNLFGNQVASKRKNMFAEFIVSESEEEIPDIQPKIFGFTNNNEQQQQPLTKNCRQSTVQKVQNTSVSSCISNDELDDWKLLPSSTMVENQFGITEEGTPVKRVRLSERNKVTTIAEDTSLNEVNKTKQSNVIVSVKNALKSKFANVEQFIVSQQSYINQSNNSKINPNKSNLSLMENCISKNESNNKITMIKCTSKELDKIENSQKLQNDKTTSQNSGNDFQKDASVENTENDNIDENDFTLRYENEENLAENVLDENNVTLQHFEDGKKDTGYNNTTAKNNTFLKSVSPNNTIESNLLKTTSTSMNDKTQKQVVITKIPDKTLSQVLSIENGADSASFELQNQNLNSSSKGSDIKEKTHAHEISKNHVEFTNVLDNIEENSEKRNCSSNNLDNDNIKNISSHLERNVENVGESQEDDIDGNITIQNSHKSNHENVNHNNIPDEGYKNNQTVMKLKVNQENTVNFEDNAEKNINNNMNETINHSEVEDEVENDENNESSKNVMQLVENEEEDETNAMEVDPIDQEDHTENGEEDENEEDDIGNNNTDIEEQEENNETIATEKDQSDSSDNENCNNIENNEVYHELNGRNTDDDGDDGDELQYESDDKANEQYTTTKDQRLSQISDISGQASRMVCDDVTEESDHEKSRTERRATLEKYLMNMKKANMEKRHQTETAIRNSLKASAPLRQTHVFKVPAIPKSPLRPQTKTLKAKPKVNHVSSLKNLPPELLEDLQYKPPRRYQPSNASWITKRLYKYLEDKLEPKYDYRARVRAEKLVETINNFTRELRRHSVAPPDAVTRLKAEMARLEIAKTHYDFYEFFHEFMPREIRVKVVPDIVNKISLPKHGVFSDILS